MYWQVWKRNPIPITTNKRLGTGLWELSHKRSTTCRWTFYISINPLFKLHKIIAYSSSSVFKLANCKRNYVVTVAAVSQFVLSNVFRIARYLRHTIRWVAHGSSTQFVNFNSFINYLILIFKFKLGSFLTYRPT